ncbi:MAG: zinc-dependent metalloprotease, partial [Chitinophagaceae bacterium]
YPINTEIRTVKTLSASPALPGAPGGMPSISLRAANAAGAVTMETNTSLLLLPAKPSAKRKYDQRIGYFADEYSVYDDNQQKVEENRFVVRWKLEPKPEDVEKWKAGALVEPVKPIIYYIDPATPKKWRKHLIAGVNDWQKAFEKAGFKNAIMGKEWPENDSSMSLEDARFSVIRYFASPIQNAYGPNAHDPRSGEILESHIGWYHNVMDLLHDWYFVQASTSDSAARKMTFDDDLMGDLIRFVSSHEVGHTLGLRHNMGSSSRTPVEKLRDKAWVEANGHTASIMDYARFNYVAQPEDKISRIGLYPRIGDYDLWAIEWGYGYAPGKDEEEQQKFLNKKYNEGLAKNPRIWFGSYEFGNLADPRTQSEDLGDNSMKASEYGIRNLKLIMSNLQSWTKEEADNYSNLNKMYGQVVTQFQRYVGHVMRNIGGYYETAKTIEQQGDIFEVVPKALQKDAVSFIQKQLLATPNWMLDKNILNKISTPNGDYLGNMQDQVLSNMLSSSRLGRMSTINNRFDNSYTIDEYFNDLEKGLFSELSNRAKIDGYRRNIQKSYVDRIIGLITNNTGASATITSMGISYGPDIKKTDVSSIARAHLISLKNEINAASVSYADKISKYHLEDLSDRIKQALNPIGK